jgi:hypothetical protein
MGLPNPLRHTAPWPHLCESRHTGMLDPPCHHGPTLLGAGRRTHALPPHLQLQRMLHRAIMHVGEELSAAVRVVRHTFRMRLPLQKQRRRRQRRHRRGDHHRRRRGRRRRRRQRRGNVRRLHRRRHGRQSGRRV